MLDTFYVFNVCFVAGVLLIAVNNFEPNRLSCFFLSRHRSGHCGVRKTRVALASSRSARSALLMWGAEADEGVGGLAACPPRT
jgi:hypothetical protein